MGVAYSNSTIIYRLIRADTSAHLRADLDAALLAAGWSRARSVTNGFVYQCRSPQGLVARLLVQDQGVTLGLLPSSPAITFQFMSGDESVKGFTHYICFGNATITATGYQVVANCCQLFLSPPGYAEQTVFSFTFSYSFAGGIPYVPTITGDCARGAADPGEVTQFWWSNGNGSNFAASQCPNFRNNYWCAGAYSYCLNGALAIGSGTASIGIIDFPEELNLQIYPLTSTNNIDYWIANIFQTRTFSDGGTGAALYIDALIGWKSVIQGQLWDAFYGTAPGNLDEIITVQDADSGGNLVTLTALTWSGSTTANGQSGEGPFWGSLYLIVDPPAPATPGVFNAAY